MDKKSVCIVGSVGGIGSSAAKLFKENNYSQIVLMDLGTESLKNLAKELDAICFDIDLRDPRSITKAFFDARKEVESIQSLLLVSGVVENHNLSTIDLDIWNEIISINLSGFFLSVKSAENWICESGRIVTLGSMAGHQAREVTGPAYAASKGGVESFTKYLSRYFAPRKITANCISPGPVDTAMLAVHDKQVLSKVKSFIPLKRFATPKEIASAALYLCSENAAYITGTIFSINGGVITE